MDDETALDVLIKVFLGVAILFAFIACSAILIDIGEVRSTRTVKECRCTCMSERDAANPFTIPTIPEPR